MQPLKELDPWAAPLDKMGLLGCPFSGVKGNRGGCKEPPALGKAAGELWRIPGL